MAKFESLWGAEFNVDSTPDKTKKIINKISNPKDLKTAVEKQIKSKKLSIEDRLVIIKENVLKILGHRINDTLVIKTKKQLVEYFDKAIQNGLIVIDTETNNSLDPLTDRKSTRLNSSH